MNTQSHLANNPPIFMDIEASSLSLHSYPIEIAWSNSEGLIETHLVDISSIPEWTDWDDYAERDIHGISRQQCIMGGKHPDWLCERLSKQIGRHTVYASGGDYDQNWIDRLFEVGSMSRIAPFYIKSSDELMLSCLSHLGREKASERLAELKESARSKVPDRHRAEPDVRYLLELYDMCRKEKR